MAIIYGGDGNGASKYQVFVNNLYRIANPVDENGKVDEDKRRPVEDVIDEFISDLRNINNTDYSKKIPEIDILGEIDEEMPGELIDYLIRSKENFIKVRKKEEDRKRREAKKKERESKEEEMERKFQDLEKTIDTLASSGSTEIDAINSVLQDIKDRKYNFDSKEKKYMTRKLQERIAQANQREKEAAQEKDRQEKEAAQEKARQEKEAAEEQARQAEMKRKAAEEQARQEQIQKKVQETWRGIQAVANREQRKTGVSGSRYWIAIRRKFAEESLKLKDEDVRNQILELFDATIIEEEDKEYFDEVKSVTRDFKSLALFWAGMRNAQYGTTTKRISQKNRERFSNLMESLKGNEYKQIKKLLEDPFTTEGDRRILLARKDVMDREYETKRKQEGR